VPLGVPLLPGELEQAVMASAGSIRSNIANARRQARSREVRIMSSADNPATASAIVCHTLGGAGGWRSSTGLCDGPIVERAVVTIMPPTVAVCVPSRVTVFEANEHVAFAGSWLQESVTVWVEPPMGATLAINVPFWPAVTESCGGNTATLKSVVLAVTVWVSIGDVLAW